MRAFHNAFIDVDQLRRLDQALLVKVRTMRTPWVDMPMRLVTSAGNAESWAVYVALTLWFFAGSRPEIPALLALSTGLATLLSQAIKRSVRRERPNVQIPGFHALAKNPDAYSFPSGHTCSFFAAATALWFVSPMLSLGLFAFGSLAGFSRIYLGAHYPFDVVIGAVLGVLAGWMAILIWSSFFG